MVGVPATTEVPLFVLTTARSARGLTVFVSVALLSAGVGSLTPTGGAILATLATFPAAAVTEALTVNVTLPPEGKVGITIPAPCMSATVVLAAVGQTALPVALPQVTAVAFNPLRAGSVKIALFAALGPALLTTMV